jgi:hypothetical protein
MVKKRKASTPSMEHKYQAIRLYNSNTISLTDLKALFRVVSVVAEDEYTSKGQQKEVLATRDRFETIKKLTETRDIAKQKILLKMNKKSPLTSTRAEHIAQFATGYKGRLPHNWKRFGSLVNRSGRFSEPRPGSSKGKIVRPTYTGFKKFNRDFDAFAKSLTALLDLDSKNRKKVNSIAKQLKNTVSVNTKP